MRPCGIPSAQSSPRQGTTLSDEDFICALLPDVLSCVEAGLPTAPTQSSRLLRKSPRTPSAFRVAPDHSSRTPTPPPHHASWSPPFNRRSAGRPGSRQPRRQVALRLEAQGCSGSPCRRSVAAASLSRSWRHQPTWDARLPAMARIFDQSNPSSRNLEVAQQQRVVPPSPMSSARPRRRHVCGDPSARLPDDHFDWYHVLGHQDHRPSRRAC